MTATASILTTETRRRPDGVALRAENSTKEYAHWFEAKDALDEVLILWLTTVSDREFKLDADRSSFRIQVPADGAYQHLTRHIEVRIILNV